MTYNNFLIFLNQIKKIPSFAGRIRLANKNLTRIGSGSGRIVYDIDGEKIFKIAKNSKGQAQNIEEVNISVGDDNDDIVTKIYDYDETNNGNWIVAEKAKKVTEKRIKELTGIPSLLDLQMYLRNFDRENKRGKPFFKLDHEIKKSLDNNEFVNRLLKFIVDHEQEVGDLGRPSTYGEVIRNGRPTIVLTDYGLNSHVYSLYYSPDRKSRYNLYELVDLNRGQIYQDFTDGNEIRNAWWGFQPYFSFDNEPGFVNEKFINFVELHENYIIRRPIFNIVTLTEEFHKAINNLSEYINKANNSLKFYRNLRKLQEYLFECGFYDREGILKEEKPNLKPLQLEKSEADVISKIVSDKLQLGVPNYIDCGSYGCAYKVNDKVLKISSDASEADAAMRIKRIKPDSLVDVYGIWEIIDNKTNTKYYAILYEYIEDRPVKEIIRIMNIIYDLTKAANMVDKRGKPLGVTGIEKYYMRNNFNYNDYVKMLKFILTAGPDLNISKDDRTRAYKFMVNLGKIKRDLNSIGLQKSRDFTNPENLGYKGDKLIHFDVGGSPFVEPPDIGSNKTIEIDEEKIPTNEINKLALNVAKKLKLGEPIYIKSGENGDAYDVGNDVIMKITSDKSEAVEATKILNKKPKFLANVYQVYKINSSKNKKFKNLYVILLEKLTRNPEINNYLKNKIKRLEFVFKNILGLELGDVLDFYGDEKYEFNKDKIDAYMQKNPKDGEFFHKLLNIRNELKKFGGISIEFLNWGNLGYKKDGTLAFFDMGWGDTAFNKIQPKEINVDEDGSSKFSTNVSVGRDDFPTYNQNSTEPSIKNDLDANSALYSEDLEYGHVTNATLDKYQLGDEKNVKEERKKGWMPGAQSVTIKKKCKLAGLGNTSVACNQGDINNLEFNSLDEELTIDENIMKLVDLPFKKDVEEYGGKIYSVGGAVRDEILGKESKDLDILITGVPIDILEKIISKYGKVSSVGKSFGILKFKPAGWEEDIDIAIPRTERATGEGGYKGFDVTSDYKLPIEKDLERRDFTINAIAKDINGNIVDPFGGLKDIKNKIIRLVNPVAFVDDPLRMLRAVQFAARFGFKIEPKTMQMIKDNAHRIKEISPERIIIELDKILKKGDKLMGAKLLQETGLYKEIFGINFHDTTINDKYFSLAKTMGEYIYLLTHPLPNPAEFYKNKLKGDIKTYKEIKALDYGIKNASDNSFKNRVIAHNMYLIYPKSLESDILPPKLKNATMELLTGRFPKVIKELAVNGYDLINMGFKDKKIGDTLKLFLIKIYNGEVNNNRKDLLSLINK